MTTTGGTTFTTTMRVIYRVHGNTTNSRTNTAPAFGTGLTQRAQAVLTVGHFTQSRAAFAKDFAHFAGTQTNGDVGTFASNQLDSSASTASYLSTFTRLQFDRVDSATYRDIAQRQSVTGLDRCIGTGDQLIGASAPETS